MDYIGWRREEWSGDGYFWCLFPVSIYVSPFKKIIFLKLENVERVPWPSLASLLTLFHRWQHRFWAPAVLPNEKKNLK